MKKSTTTPSGIAKAKVISNEKITSRQESFLYKQMKRKLGDANKLYTIVTV